MTTLDARAVDHPTDTDRRRWMRAWPLPGRAAAVYGAGLVIAFAVTTVVGLLVVHVLDDGPLGRFDRDVARWVADQRTPTRDTLAHVGSGLSDSITLTPAVVLLCLGLPLLLRRWHDAVMLGGALLLEKLAFVTSTFLVDRDRPPVPQLDGMPPTSSFPSGHVGAAVAGYGAFALVVCWHTRRAWWRGLVVALAVVAPLAVAAARMYLGMHHLSDVVYGALLGLVSILVTHAALRLGTGLLAPRDDVPERCRRLDLTTATPAGRRAHPCAEFSAGVSGPC